ncbi:ABC transporter ATP-binding protein [Acuticoccus sediminis]|uniref:ABC transporter ATP-binding protein n=1 Tax=Acuticoccus sediminis TaxID=2184697 RepID=A0A8B2NNN6_9HYPH|nr:AarF/UbiB family protein [Acuticoccus sediminis]RAI01506.1 ABC transporter ATP-binding protein [Acuticoccus sediminis]
MAGDRERNTFAGRAGRYARVGGNMSGVAAKMVASRLFGTEMEHDKTAQELARALGNLKGPLMKVAQLLSTIPDALPPEYAAELQTLQSDAPPMGYPFVKRRMAAELGANWLSRFDRFDKAPAAAASLGQVHRARTLSGEEVACKLQYPNMDSAIEADLKQLGFIFGLHRRMRPGIDTTEIAKEIADRLREELNYTLEAGHAKLYGRIFEGDGTIRVPTVHEDLSTRRLLTMGWLDGARLLNYREAPLEERNTIAAALFRAYWAPFASVGVIHGDPHLGNYTVFEEDGAPRGINLLDYGCIRIFPVSFVGGVIDLYEGLRTGDDDRVVHAYETWGFKGLHRELIDVLNIWARFIYGPILDDRTRSLADGTKPGEYGRREAFRVHQALKEKGPVTVPREFVFMDRAAVGLGAVLLHLQAELNFFQIFRTQLEGFSTERVAARQAEALQFAGLSAPDGHAPMPTVSA